MAGTPNHSDLFTVICAQHGEIDTAIKALRYAQVSSVITSPAKRRDAVQRVYDLLHAHFRFEERAIASVIMSSSSAGVSTALQQTFDGLVTHLRVHAREHEGILTALLSYTERCVSGHTPVSAVCSFLTVSLRRHEVHTDSDMCRLCSPLIPIR